MKFVRCNKRGLIAGKQWIFWLAVALVITSLVLTLSSFSIMKVVFDSDAPNPVTTVDIASAVTRTATLGYVNIAVICAVVLLSFLYRMADNRIHGCWGVYSHLIVMAFVLLIPCIVTMELGGCARTAQVSSSIGADGGNVFEYDAGGIKKIGSTWMFRGIAAGCGIGAGGCLYKLFLSERSGKGAKYEAELRAEMEKIKKQAQANGKSIKHLKYDTPEVEKLLKLIHDHNDAKKSKKSKALKNTSESDSNGEEPSGQVRKSTLSLRARQKTLMPGRDDTQPLTSTDCRR